MNEPLRSRALSCTTCGAPLDLTHVSGDAVVCSACGARDSLAARGVTRIRSYRVAPPAPATIENALRIWLTGRGLTLRSVRQSGEEAFPYLARQASMRAFLSATEFVFPSGEQSSDDGYRCVDWPFECPLAVSADERAPVPWLSFPVIDHLVFAGETALTNVELTLKNFDERLRIELTRDVEGKCSPKWAISAVSVTGTTHGELLEVWVPFVSLQYQVAPPPFGKAFVPKNDWYTAVYGAHGTVLGHPPEAQWSPFLIVGAIAIGLVLFVLVFVLLVVMAVLAPDGAHSMTRYEPDKNQKALPVSQEGPSDFC